MLLSGIYRILDSVLHLFHSSYSCWLCEAQNLSNHCFYWQCLSCVVSLWAGTARPPYWQKPVYLLDEEDERNNGYLNDDFIIWMRVSAFATFRNLYRRVRRVRHFTEGLPAGNYTFHISYSILSDSLRLLESYSDMEVNRICVVSWQKAVQNMFPVSAEPPRDLGHILTDKSPLTANRGTLLTKALLLSAGVTSTWP